MGMVSGGGSRVVVAGFGGFLGRWALVIFGGNEDLRAGSDCKTWFDPAIMCSVFVTGTLAVWCT